MALTFIYSNLMLIVNDAFCLLLLTFGRLLLESLLVRRMLGLLGNADNAQGYEGTNTAQVRDVGLGFSAPRWFA